MEERYEEQNQSYVQTQVGVPTKVINTTTYLVFSIIELCCCNAVTGVIGLIFTLFTDTALKKNSIREAEQHLKKAKISLIAGACITGAFIILYALFLAIVLLFGE